MQKASFSDRVLLKTRFSGSHLHISHGAVTSIDHLPVSYRRPLKIHQSQSVLV